jgi:hypothetical protein
MSASTKATFGPTAAVEDFSVGSAWELSVDGSTLIGTSARVPMQEEQRRMSMGKERYSTSVGHIGGLLGFARGGRSSLSSSAVGRMLYALARDFHRMCLIHSLSLL